MGFLTTTGDLALVVIGFSLIIFLHELGHFVAARWAGIRVLAFALGFGPAVVSYRKGMGVRRGSSEREYQRLLNAHRKLEQSAGVGFRGAEAFSLSPTEYRLNVLPLGGYVKMLGQDDSDPSATSQETDSFNRAPVYKRMVVISAGVVMNIVTAAILFVIVFSIGLKTESPRIGNVVPGSPAALATASVGSEMLTGLMVGDTVVSVGDDEIEAFKDISLAVAMSRKDRPVSVAVRREGYAEPITFITRPKVEPSSGMLAIGVWPAFSGTLVDGATEKDRERLTERLTTLGAPGVEPGMKLVDKAGEELDFASLSRSAKRSGGQPFVTYWQPTNGGAKGAAVERTVTPAAEFQRAVVEREGGATNATEHLAGLTPVMVAKAVAPGSNAEKGGIRAGDIFARLGDVQWPSIDDGLRQIGAPGRASIRVSVLRDGQIVDLKDEVAITQGRIGIELATTARTSSIVTRFPRGKVTEADTGGNIGPGKVRDAAVPFAATSAEVTPGSRILRVGGRATPTLLDVRTEMQALIAAGLNDIHLTVAPPGPDSPEAEGATRAVVLHLGAQDAAAVAALGWESPIPRDFFLTSEVVIQRGGVFPAIAKGLDETKKMVLTTYLTFARLFQGTVKVEHLKGPIGIADVGTKLAGKGTIWLLFFMAAVSVNLAVVNFLPLPIVDGGHFCFLLWEQFTGRPVSAAVQNVAALIGIALIGAVFLMTTYNDLANLLWR
ncbi:MAG: site-2 protease family protein [Phycisphaerales bacterium]|nr:site-2 protease family protein [Phycisphaerales bacterium]